MRRASRLNPILVAALVTITGCEKKAANSPTTSSGTVEPLKTATLPLRSMDWATINHTERFSLTNDAKGNLAFDFPESGFLSYLFTDSAPKAIRGTLSVTMQVTAAGPVVFFYQFDPANTCSAPASVRPFIWAHGHSLGSEEFDRWWSNQVAFPLQAGTTTLTVPLTPDRWSSVFGRLGTESAATEQAFKSALSDVTSLGVTFGGGCYFGHGVNVQGGRAEFSILKYQVTYLAAP
jgi:hypothetical protein